MKTEYFITYFDQKINCDVKQKCKIVKFLNNDEVVVETEDGQYITTRIDALEVCQIEDKKEEMWVGCDCSSPLERQVGGDHYKMKIQPIEFIHANNIPFIEANCIKYLCRHRKKDGVKDLDKVIHYVELLKELEYGREK